MTMNHPMATRPASLHRLLELRAAEQPDRTFVLHQGRWWTYRELELHARAIARELLALGVKPGDHVAVMMPGCEPYLALWFAISKVGAVEVPLNGAYRGEVLKHVLRTATPRIAFVHGDHRAVFEATCPGILDVRDVLDPYGDRFAWHPEDADALAKMGPGLEVDPSAPASIIFTSGTTGLSKGVVTSQRHQMSFGHFFTEIVGFTPADTAYNFLPFFHIAAKFETLGAMLAGGRMMLTASFSLSSFWKDVKESSATLCVAVGGLCHMLNGIAPAADDADNTLRLIYAVPVPWAFKDAFEQRFGLQLVEAYGSTESNLVLYTRLGEELPPGTCGRANASFEITIQNDEGRPVPPGIAGEICMRAQHDQTLMSGYLGLPDKTAEAMRGGCFHSGDQGYMDENGFVFFLDRSKDAIRRRGENISSYEVERLLNAHPDVAEVAVVPVKAVVGEDEVKAVIVRRGGSSLEHEALLDFAVATMPYFMVPRYVEFREQLPRTETMKVRKVELRNEGITPETWDCERAGLRVTRRGLERKAP